MKTISMLGAQGDVMFRKITELPSGLRAAPDKEGRYIVAHSETGHHHYLEVVPGVIHFVGNDPLVAYLSLDIYADVIHGRPQDTHETMRLAPGVYEIRRQREYTPTGFRRVED